MAASIVTRINIFLQTFKHQFSIIFGKPYPPDYALCLVGMQSHPVSSPAPKFSLKDIINDGFLWGVPRNRRTIEKRWKRKYGHPEYGMKIILPKNYLRTCNVCGDDHEAGVLCPTCYKKVIDETREMQEAIQKELKIEPVEQEVVVLYDGDRSSKPEEFFEGKRIVEMKKPRPAWFSKNLLQGTTQKPAQTSDVKPTDLG